MLGLHQNAGVTKKAKRGRKAVLSTRARRRHARGLERAEEIVDRTANKVQKSKRAAVSIEERKKAWDEVNGSVGQVGGGKSSNNMFAGLAAADGTDEEVESVEEFDDEMADAAVPAAPEGAQVPSASVPVAAAAAPPPPVLDDGDEEIL